MSRVFSQHGFSFFIQGGKPEKLPAKIITSQAVVQVGFTAMFSAPWYSRNSVANDRGCFKRHFDQEKNMGDMLDLYSQKLTAKVPANGPSQKGIVHLPTIRIQVLCVSFRECKGFVDLQGRTLRWRFVGFYWIN